MNIRRWCTWFTGCW